MLLFGAALPDGSKSSTGAHPQGFFEGSEEPDAPVLLMRNGGGNGGDDELSGSCTLWLWPLPPAGTLQLVAEWRDFGLRSAPSSWTARCYVTPPPACRNFGEDAGRVLPTASLRNLNHLGCITN